MMSLVLFGSLVGVVSAGHGLHASWTQIEQLRQSEVKVIAQIRTILQSMSELSTILQGYVSSWEEVVEESGDLSWDDGDPAAAFSLLRHTGLGWTRVDQALHQANHVVEDIGELARRADTEPLPNTDDVAAASEAVARLAHVYRLNSTLLAHSGLLLHTAVEGGTSHHYLNLHQYHALSVSDLADIGLAAVNKGLFSVGVDFLGAARARAAVTHNRPNLVGDYSTERLDGLLSTAIKVHDHVLEIRGPRSLTHVTAPTPYGEHTGGGGGVVLQRGGRKEEEERRKDGRREGSDGEIGKEKREGRRDEAMEEEEDSKEVVLGVQYLKRHGNQTWMLEDRPLVERLQVERLCRGEDLRPSLVTSKLKCMFVSGGSAWLLLAPFKVEQVSLDPYIALVYGVLSQEETGEVRTRAAPHLHVPHNPTLQDPASHSPTSTNQRKTDPTLKHVWLQESQTGPLQRLGRRLSHLLGVSFTDRVSEPYMVADYGLGGSYDPHRDTHGPLRTPPNPVVGERMATVLTFLHPPAQGGVTVFPWVGVGVSGRVGAAAVWWNLLASHEHDFLTRHAACPVLRGHKWVSTKWVGYNGQWRSLPCPADPSRKITLPSH